MDTEWILIANGTLARLFSRESETEPLVPLCTFKHPEGRAKSMLGGDDRFQHRISPHHKELHRFAVDLALQLEHGLSTGQCARISIFSSSPLLGELKARLGPAGRHALRVSADVDLTRHGLSRLEERIALLTPSHHRSPVVASMGGAR